MTVSHEMLNAVAQVSAERMVESLMIGIALAVFAWALLRVLPRQNSATRFALWFAALIATAILPFCTSASKASNIIQTATPSARPLISVPGSWALCLFGFWALFATIALTRIAVGFLELRRVRRQCQAIEDGGEGWREMVGRACPARRVEILTSDRIHVPTAIGFFHPAVVIPARLLTELSAAELQQVLLHELAHLRRWDDWTNLVQRFVKAVLFFHPAVWWMEERISLEREMACDDAVLAETASPRAYAECLASLAEKSFLRRSATLAQAAVNRIRETTLRVAQILDVNRSKSVPARKSALAVVGAFACGCGVIAWQAPQLVGFENPPPLIASAPIPPVTATTSTKQPRFAATTASRLPEKAAYIAKPRAPQPQAIMAKASAAEQHAVERSQSVNAVRQQHAAPRVVQAKSAENQPALRTGVVVIFVNDPVFGPTPIFWHFAVWQFTPPQHDQQGATRKTI
jgi:beta-lactamase regulating signal transducer with metallopeptidase domain